MCSYRPIITSLAAVLICQFSLTGVQAGHLEGPLYAVPQVKTGWRSGAMEFGDVNGDGNIDAVTANTTDQTLSILIGDGEGGFTLSGSVPASTHPVAVVLQDFNGNGRLDIAVADREDNTVQIFLGDGAGNFTAGPIVAVSVAPWKFAAGDFNGDGLADLAVLHVLDGVIVLINSTGVPGTFTEAHHLLPADGIGFAVAAGDSDGDGDPDLAIATSGGRGSGTIHMFHNYGAAGFTEGAPVISGRRAEGLTFVDFDGDGDLDLATIDNERSISIAENVGFGTYSAAVPHAVADVDDPASIDSADLDGDGRGEVVALWNQDSSPGHLTILDRDATGTTSIQDYQVATRPLHVRAVGIDGDGRLDIAILAAALCNRSGCIFQGSLNVLLNKGLAGLGNYSTTPSGDGPVDTVAADFNGDGYTDIATVNSDSNTVSILENDGNGRFRELDTITDIFGAFSLVAADFDDDGDEDIVFSTAFAEVYLAQNLGDGTFSKSRIHIGGRSPVLTAADMDGDSDIDVFVAYGIPLQPGLVEVLINDGTGNFSVLPTADRPEEGIHRHAIVDIDGDGDKDAVLGQELIGDSGTDMSLSVFRNNGEGTFATPVKIPLGEGLAPVGVAAGDIDNDGDPDFIVGDAANATIRIFTNSGGTLSPASTLSSSPELRDIAVADLDEDGRLDIIAANGIVAETDGPAAIPAESIQVWYGETTGGFSAPQDFMSGWTPIGISVAAFTETGRRDISVADEENGDVWLLKQSGVLPGLRIDLDLDGLIDSLEISLDLPISDPDSDNDGLLDGIDPSVIAGLIEDIPIDAFRNAGQKKSLISQLQGVEQKVVSGQTRQAIDGLQMLGGYYDGCLTTKDPDFNDRVRDCTAQFEIRNLQDVVVTNLRNMQSFSFP